jgi:hypothetical protein
MSTTIIPPPNYPDPEQAYSYAYQTGYSGYGGGYASDFGGGYSLGGAFGTQGIAAGYPKGDDKPGKPAIMSCGNMQFIPDGGVILSRAIDDVMGNLGSEVYDLMSQDDACSAALSMLVYSIMGGEITVEPAIIAEPGERLDDTTDPQRKQDIEDAQRYADEVQRSIDRVPDFLDQCEAILTEGLIRGSGLADPSWEVVKGPGDDKPITLLKSLQCRGHRTWAMVVDPYGQFVQVAGYSWDGPKIYDRDRFVVFVNSPRRGDPRGTSDLRPAYEPWNLKVQARPERSKWLATFASPTAVVTYDQNTQPTYPINPATGEEDTTLALLTPQAQAERVAANIHGNSWMAVPAGWTVELIESKSDTGAFSQQESDYNDAIIQGILLSSRTLNEAAHGSKADSENSTSTTQIKVGRKEKSFSKALERGLCRVQTLMNHGEDAANRLCPRIKFPDTNAVARADIITAFTGAGWSTTGRQHAHIDARFGLPVRTADEIDEAKAQADAAQQATIDATKAKAAGGLVDGDGNPVDDATKDGKPDKPGLGKPGDVVEPAKPDAVKIPKVKPKATKTKGQPVDVNDKGT